MKKASNEKVEKSNFTDKISQDIPREHWDLIFGYSENTSNQKSVASSRRADEMQNSFYIDEKKYQKNEFYQNNAQQNKYQNLKNKKSDWKSNNNYSKNTLYENNHRNPQEFINQLQMSLENNFSIDNSYVKVDSIQDNSIQKFDSCLFESMSKTIKNKEDSDEEHFERNPNKTFLTKDIKKKFDEIPIFSVDTQTNYNFRDVTKKNSFSTVDTKSIFKINEKLNYPKDEPLWYIYHVISKSSFGPVSSAQLQEMYNKQNIDGMSDVRLIDIFKLKNKGCFAYFKLKEVENPNFLSENIEPTLLLKYVEELKKIKKEDITSTNSEKRIEKNNAEKENSNKLKQKQKFIDVEEIFSEPSRNQAISNKEKNMQQVLKTQAKENNTIKIKNEKSVIDEEFEDNNTNKTQNSVQGNIKKKAGKKLKGKPVEIDIKTGFFTLSQQEKEYEPIYICGDSQDKKK